MQDVRKALAMFEKVRIPLLGIVENMSYFEVPGTHERHYLFGQDGGKTLASKYRTQLLEQIPIVQKVREGGDTGRPVVISEPSSPVAKQFRSLARAVAQQVSIQQAVAGQSEPIQIGKFT